MIGKRIPHQFVLAFAFSLIGVGLAVAIIGGTTAALRQADGTIGYAAAELQGIRYLQRTHTVLDELLRFRAALVDTPAAAIDAVALPSEGRADSDARIAALSASIAAIPDGAAAKTALDDGIADTLGALQKGWRATLSQTDVAPQDVSALIETIQPLLSGIAGASGISNDPSIDGINFGDAIVRFPLSLAYGSEAASIATANVAAGDWGLRQRFTTARLLAQAQTAVDVGLQDAEDEMAVDPVAGAPLASQSAANVRDFERLKDRVTSAYVESDAKPRRALPEGVLAGDLATFSGSSFAVIDSLRSALVRVTSARIAQARERRSRLLLEGVGGIVLELLMTLTLAWISIVSYRNQRERQAAERSALDAQRAGLEVQLTHAKAQQALLHAKAQFRTVFDRAPTGMIIVDRQCRILESNEAARAILPPSDDDPISASSVVVDHEPAIEHIFAGSSDLHAAEREYPAGNDRSRWFHVSISPVHDEFGAALFAILMIRDVTDSKSMEAQLVFEAGHDSLTGLPNRKRFLTILQRTLDDRALENAPGVFSVVFIDFNDFKTINDSFGHQAGDKFLVDGAARLRDSVRSTDIVARVGGDEFAVILHATDRAEIEKSVVRLQSVVSRPVNIEGQLVSSSASFGIAQADVSYTLAAEIIRDADTAMYQAKAEGGRNFVVFDLSMREKVVRRMQLSIDIIHALAHGEMELMYQPIVDLRDGKVAGCEALLRWRRADGSVISPTEFLPLAEENGSIVEIGRWVMTTACEQMHTWNARAKTGGLPGLHADFVMHVNLAVPEVHHVELVANLKRTLAKTNVAREQIILEITEGVVLKITGTMRSTLDALTREGFRLCIDDFGTGYSSLRYLNELPLHGFKIDRSFVSNGSDDLANASIVEMLLVLGRSLGLNVVAEGIETATQWEKLRGLGCRFGQGYLFAQALDGSSFTAMLKRDAALATPALRLRGARDPAV
jgi:diguanylate cyclase (GGDEF)-like protein/PAS domain S-box-containing protein